MLHVGKFDIPAGTFCGLLFMPGFGFIWEFRMKNFDSRGLAFVEIRDRVRCAVVDKATATIKSTAHLGNRRRRPWGRYDLSARLVARHLPRFISGNPNVVVRNMPGASSNLVPAHVQRRCQGWERIGNVPALQVLRV